MTSANVDEMRKPAPSPEIKRLLGVGDDLGQKLGLSADWAYNIVKQVGNYGEIFERNVGEKTPLGLPRGLNALWIRRRPVACRRRSAETIKGGPPVEHPHQPPPASRPRPLAACRSPACHARRPCAAPALQLPC